MQQIIHQLKYKGQQQVGTFFGNWYGTILREDGVFKDVDVIIPVPLHKKRLKQRGYNQVTTFSRALGEKLDIVFDETSFKRTKNTSRQVFRSRGDRWQRLQNAFAVIDEKNLKGKHILLVDDVITTGATLEACANILLKIPGTTISIVTLAVTE
ncbi:ComF family protein [Spongiivirga citrea]|uniref:ComF family protein n=1 Tax=Spongiivirga citrea TaxID=1481457 RepID=A0A6M0CGP7_9FLAO|nr:ComF family protein [Spongiivirga citrea]NER17086.1 ComF family protein [Spongiivirga citrea]